jgi:hypothetical protein
MIRKKHIYVTNTAIRDHSKVLRYQRLFDLIDALCLVVTIAVIVGFFVFFQPKLYSPIQGLTTTGAVLFSFSNGDYILIDDNAQFTSPQRYEVQDDLIITLNPGNYYWKVVGAVSSEIRQLTIQSIVDLRLRESKDGYDLVNGGNTKLDVDIYENGTLTGKAVLDIDKSVSGNGNLFVGREHA